MAITLNETAMAAARAAYNDPAAPTFRVLSEAIRAYLAALSTPSQAGDMGAVKVPAGIADLVARNSSYDDSAGVSTRMGDLRAVVSALSSTPVGKMDADLFWDDENPEESYRDVGDIFDAIGEAATYLKVRRAKSLPDAWVSCVLEDEDASNWTITYHENEESAQKAVQDARATPASPQGDR